MILKSVIYYKMNDSITTEDEGNSHPILIFVSGIGVGGMLTTIFFLSFM